MKKLGIDKILASLLAAVHIANTVDESLEDQRITPVEWGQISLTGFQFAWTLVKIKEIRAQFLDLDQEEKDQLITALAAELDLTNEKAEILVEKIFMILLQLSSLLKPAA